ncbi:hypothetical protein [Candidatus Phytoplasma meliae]|uniref:Uncharacterized protein n=1 Tax=Candidatus Phytoplasma meliae TaxID=1848402 RepID=A0ABS5CYR4_9MOLU|nr:hypothetical protein [Candidatus Phytoplasma meliae]MBP5836118.1 hypothetical protein [Candidatus Phytoplasma meliae]
MDSPPNPSYRRRTNNILRKKIENQNKLLQNPPKQEQIPQETITTHPPQSNNPLKHHKTQRCHHLLRRMRNHLR